MAVDKIGPWKREDWAHFLTLDVKLRPATANSLIPMSGLLGPDSIEPGGALARVWWSEERAKLIDEAWSIRRTHPVYKALETDPSFRAAWSVFERRRKAATGGEIASANAPFLFLREFVENAGFAYQWRGRSGRSTYGAHAKRRRAAVKYARGLRDLFDNGVCLPDYAETRNLRALLQRVTEELPKMKRKDYGGAREAERWVLKNFAHSLVLYCGLQSPAVVTHFARMVGLACESKTAQRYCNEAATKKRRLLAAALLRAAEKGTPPR